MNPRWIAGVDGCPGGWAVIQQQAGSGETRALKIQRLSELSDLSAGLIAIDMPIGLHDEPQRACDQLARGFLGPRRSSIFPAPLRSVLKASSYEEAKAVSRGISGKGLSLQSWNLMPKIREIDELLKLGHLQAFECHPEVSFLAWAGVMLPPKKTREGRQARTGLISREMPSLALPTRHIEDFLDAAACLWTAQRILAGTAVTIPEVVPVDEVGTPMCIYY